MINVIKELLFFCLTCIRNCFVLSFFLLFLSLHYFLQFIKFQKLFFICWLLDRFLYFERLIALKIMFIEDLLIFSFNFFIIQAQQLFLLLLFLLFFCLPTIINFYLFLWEIFFIILLVFYLLYFPLFFCLYFFLFFLFVLALCCKKEIIVLKICPMSAKLTIIIPHG